ncbi:MAG: DNA-binding protein [Rhodocyclaceae bacterium]|nr:DNA-binding protein [Rhodocyclaceae bacterium]
MTSEQIKTRLRRQGITLTQWAKDHGYPRADVYRVLNGQYKCHYGRAHEIAVKLGMKAGAGSDQMAA